MNYVGAFVLRVAAAGLYRLDTDGNRWVPSTAWAAFDALRRAADEAEKP